MPTADLRGRRVRGRQWLAIAAFLCVLFSPQPAAAQVVPPAGGGSSEAVTLVDANGTPIATLTPSSAANTATPQPAPTLVSTATPQPAPTLFPTCAAGIMLAGTGGQGAQCGPTLTPRPTDTPAPTATPSALFSSDVTVALASDQAITQNVFTTVVGASLVAGTWYASTTISLIDSAAQSAMVVRIFDGTTTYCGSNDDEASIGFRMQLSTSCVFTLAGTVTVNAQVASSSTTATAKAALLQSAGNKASNVTFLRRS